jgi:hypothetical protein
MENRAVFSNTEVRYTEFIDHIKKGGTIDEFAHLNPNVSTSQMEEFLAIRNRILEFHAAADKIKKERNRLPIRKGKQTHDVQIGIIKGLCTRLIGEMESFLYSIQNTEFFPNTIGELDNLIIGCKKLRENPFDRLPL